jgi:putative SOS response-associated peptidase YedK
MCGRFALTASASTITEIFQVAVLPDVLPQYNVAPTTKVLCIVNEGGTKKAARFRWGLIPFWAKDKKIGHNMINARSETVAKKPSFRTAFRKRRLLVLADGFYEWKRDGKTKIPHLIGMRNGEGFAMAGIWERWTDKETDEDIRSCSIITTGPNTLMANIHNRMPVILPRAHWDQWLDASVDDPVQLQELLVPYPADLMAARRVSKAVGNVKNKGPHVQGPWEGDGL